MNYSDLIYNARSYFPVITALFFIINLIGGKSEDRNHSLILCFLCALYFMTPNLDIALSKSMYFNAYIEALFVEILITGAGMLIMFLAATFDKLAFKHALILAFIILTNFMLTWHYTVSSSPFFYNYFDELIITASFLQIMVSRNGFIGAISSIFRFFRSAQDVVYWAFISYLCRMGDIQKHKKSKEGT